MNSRGSAVSVGNSLFLAFPAHTHTAAGTLFLIVDGPYVYAAKNFFKHKITPFFIG